MRCARAVVVAGLVVASGGAELGAQGRGQTPATPASAGGFAGTWEARTPAGGTLTLVLTQQGTQVRGTLSGNGLQFEVEAQVGADGGFYGTARGRDGTLFIGGETDGAQLGLALAELTAAGVPDPRTAQELRMTRAAAGAGAGSASAAAGSGSAASGGAGAGAGAGAATGRGDASLAATPQDQQIATLLMSSPWCNMRYAQQMGATTIERVTFTRDGRFASRTQRESAVNNSQGSYYGNSTDGAGGFWRVQNGNLMLSADGQRFEAAPLQISRNSNGYPIVTAAGKEYYQCN
jgi:hypothetical protein